MIRWWKEIPEIEKINIIVFVVALVLLFTGILTANFWILGGACLAGFLFFQIPN